MANDNLSVTAGADGRGRAGRSRQRLSLEDIVETAGRLADRHGLAAVKMSHIAEELGRNHSSLYNHVSGMDAIRRELALRTVSRLAEVLTAAALGRSGADAVFAMARAYRDFVRSCRGRFEAAYSVRFVGDDELQEVYRRTAAIIDAVLRAYNLTPAATFRAHVAISSAIRGFVLGEDQLAGQDDADATFDEMIELFVIGLTEGNWPRRAESDPGGNTLDRAGLSGLA